MKGDRGALTGGRGVSRTDRGASMAYWGQNYNLRKIVEKKAKNV